MNCYLGLGANLGDSRKNLRQAIELISKVKGIELISVSHFYESEPWGVKEQPNFINAAIRIKTSLQPLQLLDKLQNIEYKLGRVRNEHWGARTIDIDVLTIEDMTIDDERLKVPHKYMFERDFVLIPLNEISNISGKLHGDRVVKTHGCLRDFNLKLIACVDRNFGLGLNGQLLFHIDEDMKHFRELTINNTVIMGRKTFESIGKPLANRRNIILSKNLENIAGVEIVNNLEQLYQLLHSTLDINSALRITHSALIIGGGEIYKQLIPFIDEAYITVVDEIKEADVYLTNFDNRDDFRCVEVDKRNKFEFRFYQKNF